MPRILRQLMHRRIVMVSALVLLVIAVLAIGAPPFPPLHPHPSPPTAPTDPAVLAPRRAPSPAPLLGTDELGRDLYARIVHGARYSLAIAALTALGAVVAGTVLGLM